MFKIQPSFTAGELAPSMYARVDLSKFHVGCRKLLNFISLAYGGVATRPGTMFVGEVSDSTKRHRLVRFQFSTTQAYILVFGDETLRIVKDRGVVVRTVADTNAWVTSTSYSPYDYVDNGGLVYRCIDSHTSGSTKEPGVGVDWEDYWVQDAAVQIATPYTEADLPNLAFTQSADTLFITHPSYAPRKLTRSAHITWTMSTISFAPPISAPTGLTATPSGLTAGSWDLNYKVAAIDADGKESTPSSAATTTYNGTWTAGGKVALAWTAVTGASEYAVYKDENGYYGWIGNATTNEFFDRNITPATDDSPQDPKDPFNGSGNYPAVVAIHAQRTVWGGSNNKPSTFLGSRVGDYTNMNTSSPLKADDSYTFTLDGNEVNRINGMCSLRELIVFTSGVVSKASGNQDEAISPKSINVKAQSYWGSHGLPPIVTGESALFVEYGGRVVRDLVYSLEVDGYKGSDLTVLSNHMFKGRRAYEWAHARNPYGIVWIVCDDGALRGLTYLREHDVVGMHRHETDGLWESVAAIPGSEQDDTYFIVKRTINGVTKRYVEVMPERIEGGDVQKAFCVDSGLIYSGAATSTLTGLGHLEGKTVAVFANGSVEPQAVVEGGSITLQRTCTYAVVGLPFTCDFESLDIDGEDSEGTSVGRLKNISSVIVKVEDTRGFWAGRDFSHLDEIRMLDEAYGDSPIPLFTGEKQMTLEGGYETSARVCIRQSYPLPLTISAIVPEVTISEQRREAYRNQRS